MKFRKLFLILIVCFSITELSAQDERVRAVLKTGSGVLVVWNEPEANFTLEVKGRDFQKIENKNMAFLIDGKFLQVVSAFTKEFLTEVQQKEKLDESKILASHLSWETAYLSSELNEKLMIESEQITLQGGKIGVLWGFPVPKTTDGMVKKQVFLTVAKGASVLVLNGAVTSATDEKAVRAFLIETAKTLRTYEKPLSQKEATELAVKAN
ncbi:MAG: hypothetical protein ABL952_16255 [Pyrinomonadaceae bacterium]